jgi:hypothetical protein
VEHCDSWGRGADWLALGEAIDAPLRNIAELQKQLNARNWAAADQETRRLLSVAATSAIPLALIREIDRAWLAASAGRFGLGVQAKIW